MLELSMWNHQVLFAHWISCECKQKQLRAVRWLFIVCEKLRLKSQQCWNPRGERVAVTLFSFCGMHEDGSGSPSRISPLLRRRVGRSIVCLTSFEFFKVFQAFCIIYSQITKSIVGKEWIQCAKHLLQDGTDFYKGIIPCPQYKTCSEYWWHLFAPSPLYFSSQGWGRDITDNELLMFPWKSCHQQRWGRKVGVFQSEFPRCRERELPCLCASPCTFSSCYSVELEQAVS